MYDRERKAHRYYCCDYARSYGEQAAEQIPEHGKWIYLREDRLSAVGIGFPEALLLIGVLLAAPRQAPTAPSPAASLGSRSIECSADTYADRSGGGTVGVP